MGGNAVPSIASSIIVASARLKTDGILRFDMVTTRFMRILINKTRSDEIRWKRTDRETFRCHDLNIENRWKHPHQTLSGKQEHWLTYNGDVVETDAFPLWNEAYLQEKRGLVTKVELNMQSPGAGEILAELEEEL